MSGNFKSWYEGNRDALSQRRKERYSTDPEYRARAMARSESYRQRKRAARPELPGLTIGQVCELLDISDWTLNKWRNEGYYPPPDRVNNKPVFYMHQLELLRLIKQFFEAYPKRASAAHRDELQQIVEVIFHSWRR